MGTWKDSTIGHAVYFANDTGKPGLAAIEARRTADTSWEIRLTPNDIVRGDPLLHDQWNRLVKHAEARMQSRHTGARLAHTQTDHRNGIAHYQQGAIAGHSKGTFENDAYIIPCTGGDTCDIELVALLGALSTLYFTHIGHDGTPQRDFMLNTTETTIAVKELKGVSPTFEKLFDALIKRTEAENSATR